MNHLHRVRLAALARAVVHDRHARLQRVNEHGGVRDRLAVMRDDEEIHGAEAVARAHQVEFLVPREVAEVHHPELART